MSIAEVTAIEFSVPIWILVIDSIFIKEKLTKTKIVSILLGFVGVLIIRPGLDLINAKSLIVLLSFISYAIAHTSTKKLTAKFKPSVIIFIMCLLQIPVSFFFDFIGFEYTGFKELIIFTNYWNLSHCSTFYNG